MRKWITVVAPLLALAPWAQAYTIDFGESGSPVICSNTSDGLGALVGCSANSYLSQSYGDQAGVSDITYSAPRVPGISLRWWDTNYNNLYGVAWADGGDASSQARIEIRAVNPADIVTLSSFDLGAYPSTSRDTTLTITTLDGDTLFAPGETLVGNGSTSATIFTPNVSAAGGLVITWQDSAYNVGIDHISYSVSAVPEPAALALMLVGLGAVGWRARRRA